MGGNAVVNYQDYGITEFQWKQLSAKAQEFCNCSPNAAKQLARLLSRGISIQDINAYYENIDVKGMTVEKEVPEVAPEDNSPEAVATREKEKLEQLRTDALKTTPEMMESRDMRKLNEAQWEAYFLERYKQNPAEARKDIVQVMYYKEVRETKQTLQNMMRDTKAEKMLKSKYLAEGYATEEEKERYEARKAELRKLYMDAPRAKYDEQIKSLQEQLNNLPETDESGKAALREQIKEVKEQRERACDKAALDAYNSIRPPHEKVQEKDWVQEGEHLSTEQIEAILDLKALDAFDITEGKIEEMAIGAVSEHKFNEGVAKVTKMREEIAKLKEENITPEVQRVQNKAIMADREYDEKIAKLLQEAETEESLKLRQEATEANLATRAEVARLRKAGKTEEADALEKKRLEDKAAAEKKIQEALDQDKLSEANKLTEERQAARETAQKAAYEALPEKVKEKIKKLEEKIQKTMAEANEENNSFLTDNIQDLAKIMAETQINKQRAENNFNKTVVDYTKLDKDIQEWIQENPEDFAEEAKEGETATFTTKVPVLDEKGRQVYDENGDPKMDEKHWVFKSEKFKNYALAFSNDNNLDNDEAVDPSNRADYRADMQDRKKVTRDRKGEQAVTKFKDRRFAAKVFKAAGIETEKDRTFLMQSGAAVKAFGKGFIVGGVGALAAEYLSTTKVVESKFFKLVQYSGSVPWSKMVHYEGETDATLTGRFQKTIEGDVDYHQEIVVEGEATGYVSFDYEGDVGYSGQVGYSGEVGYSGQVGYSGEVGYSGQAGYSGSVDYSGTVSGVASGNYSGTASGTVPVTHKDYQNGILIGEYTENVQVDLPYSGSMDIPYEQGYTGSADYSGVVDYSGTVGYEGVADYSGTVGYEGVADYSGTAHYNGTVGGNVSIPYKKVVYADGTVHWVAEVDEEVVLNGKAHYEGDMLVEGEAEYSGEEEVSGTTKGSPKINLKNVLNIGLGAGVASVIASLPDIAKIKDEGMRKETIRRQVLSDKGVDDRKTTQPTAPPTPPTPPKPEVCYAIDGIDAVAGQEATPDEDVFNLEMNKKGNVIFWYQTADAYPIPEGFKASDIYNAIREKNGDPDHNKYPPNIVGLPEFLELKDKNGNTVRIERKDKFTIKGTNYIAPKGGKLGTGKTYVGFKGKPAIEGKPGNYRVYDCKTGETLVDHLPNEQAALNWIEARKKEE